MTGNSVEIRTTGEKQPVEVRRKTAEMLDFPRIGPCAGFLSRFIGHVGDQTL